MSSVNKVILVGRVGRDPESRYLNNGDAVVNFSLATSTRKKDGVDDTQWHRITAYGKVAEVIGNYVKKGSLIYIEGSLKYGKFRDKEGNEKNTIDIIANQMQMLGNKSDDDRRNHENEEQQNQRRDTDDDIPFN
jgi:single-strand DNA-binding protein